MKATQIIVGETYAYSPYARQGLPWAYPVKVLATPARGSVAVIRTDNDDAKPFTGSTRKVWGLWTDYEVAKVDEQERHEAAAAFRAELEATYQTERAELLNLLGDHGVKADTYRVQKHYGGHAQVTLTLEEVRALIAARPLALHFPEADIPLPA